MNIRRSTAATAAIVLFALIWNGLVHMVILAEANLALNDVARAPEQRSVVLAVLLTVGIAATFVSSFNLWAGTGRLREGLVHGGIFAVLAGLLVDLNQYVLYPIPGLLALQWFLFGTVEFLGYGLIASFFRSWRHTR